MLLQQNITKTMRKEFRRERKLKQLGICCVYKQRWERRSRMDKEYRRNRRNNLNEVATLI
jgi:hypothetical protein